MNNALRAATFFAIAAFAVGCKPSDDTSTSQQMENVKVETKADERDMKEYAFAQKAEFVAKMQVQMDALNKDLDTLAAKIDKSSDEVKAEAKPKLQAMRDEAAVMNSQLNEARNATASTWDKVKASSEKAYDGMKDDFTKARQWASDKIAP